MNTYILNFIVNSVNVSIDFSVENIPSTISLGYKHLVDDKISEWLITNNVDGKSANIIDIVLLDSNSQIVFSQADRKVIGSIYMKDVETK
jgi:hypothetical protein